MYTEHEVALLALFKVDHTLGELHEHAPPAYKYLVYCCRSIHYSITFDFNFCGKLNNRPPAVCGYHRTDSLACRSPATRFRWLQQPVTLRGNIWALDNIYLGDGCPWMCSGHGYCRRGVCQ